MNALMTNCDNCDYAKLKLTNRLALLGALLLIGLAMAGAVRAQGNKFISTNGTAPREKVAVGGTTRLGAGKIRSWAKTDGGKLTAIGVTFDENALKDLPTEPPPGEEGTWHVLPVPAEAANSVFTHILVNWNPRGHEPSKIYDIGHFDFHFYLMPEKDREAITAKGDDTARSYKALPADEMPNGYVVAPNSAVPAMGAHLVDPRSHEFHGKSFTKTFLYGIYDGRIIFLEPMITRDYLATKPNVTEELVLPTKFAKSGRYPTKYTVKYDPETKEYTIALEGMVDR